MIKFCNKLALCFFLFFFLFVGFSVAKKFSNSYVSFNLLNNWHCYPDGTEWVCTNKLNRKKASEAMVILTAKQKGPLDSFALYIKHLKTPRTVKTSKGSNFTSKVMHVKQRQIGNHTWVDGFHQGSEVSIYYTRYLATIKGNLAILITYSAHKDHYKKYASDFARSIDSLRVMKVSPGFAGSQRGSVGMGTAQDYLKDMIGSADELSGTEIDGEGIGEQEGLAGLLEMLKKPEYLAALAFLVAIIGYLALKKKKKRKKRVDDPRRRDRHRHRHSRSRSSSADRQRRSGKPGRSGRSSSSSSSRRSRSSSSSSSSSRSRHR